MTVKDFLATHCKGRCPHFDRNWGCEAYDGEECDAAFCHPRWRGLTMRQRIEDYCEKNQKESK